MATDLLPGLIVEVFLHIQVADGHTKVWVHIASAAFPPAHTSNTCDQFARDLYTLLPSVAGPTQGTFSHTTCWSP